MRLRISIVILTSNRARLLADCLAALENQTRPPDEILIVDNGSTDGARAMLSQRAQEPATPSEASPLLPSPQASRLRHPAPAVRVIQGPRAGGWAAARNLGVREAGGDWVAFTDDDCIPAPDWVARIESLAFEEWDTVGGQVEPAEPLPWPWWWHPDMSWCVGLTPPGIKEVEAGAVHYGQTANWASRRDLLLKEPFQEIAATFEGGAAIYQAGREDAELWRRLRQKGYRVRFDLNLRVGHRIGRDRLWFKQVLRRAWLDGVALQRRQPNRDLLAAAVNTWVGLPGDLLFGIWQGKAAPWREAAWKLVWAVRQAGQWGETLRCEGFSRTALRLAAFKIQNITRRSIGWTKRISRRIGARIARPPRASRARIRSPRRVAVAAAGYLGDMILLHPFLSGLKSQRPEVRLSLLTNRIGEEVYRHDPAIDCLALLDQNPHTLRAVLRREQPEMILVPYFYDLKPGPLYASPKTRVATFEEEVGFTRRWWYDLADRRVPKPAGVHEAVNLRHLFHEAGFDGNLPYVSPAFLPEELESVGQTLRDRGLCRDNMVLLAPGTGRANKLWPQERWAEILRYLTEEFHLRVVFVGAPSEEALCQSIAAQALGTGNARTGNAPTKGGAAPATANTSTAGGAEPETAKTGRKGGAEPQTAKTGSGGGAEPETAEVGRKGGAEPETAKTGSGGGAEPETAKVRREGGAAQVIVECRLSIREMALWIAEARLVVCVDNGVKHLAVAMDTPSLALFGPCDERQWGAIRNPHKHGVVRGCAWNLTLEERVGLTEDHQMRCITTHQVRNALNEMLTEH